MSDSLKTRVLLVDDHTMLRESLKRVLEDSGRIVVVGEVGDGAEVMRMVRATQPDVIVLDYSMPNHDATSVIEEVLTSLPSAKILVLTVHENIHYAVRVLQTGAHGYLIKSAAVDELVRAISIVRTGNIYLSSAISPEVLRHLRQPRRERQGVEALSPREFDFLRLYGAGKSLQQCAREMGVGVSTVSTYRSRIMEKLNLSTSAELIRFAIEQDIVS
jgi:DNA-binding NarL/FixJ family response regulator